MINEPVYRSNPGLPSLFYDDVVEARRRKAISAHFNLGKYKSWIF